MGQAGPVVITLGRDKDLRLVLETTKRLRVNDAITIALIGEPHRIRRLSPQAAASVLALRREARKPDRFLRFQPLANLWVRPGRGATLLGHELSYRVPGPRKSLPARRPSARPEHGRPRHLHSSGPAGGTGRSRPDPRRAHRRSRFPAPAAN